MKARLKHLVEVLRSGFWPLPSLIAVLGYAAAEACLFLDRAHEFVLDEWSYPLSAAGSRALLSTAATGVATLGALVFSTTLVALTLASSQFGPRLLNNFIRARTNQLTLGGLLGTFLFCLVVLRSTSRETLPDLSILVAFILTVGSVALFLYFVHHLVRSLQAETIVEGVARTLFVSIDKVFPERAAPGRQEREAEGERERWSELQDETAAFSEVSGYLQFVDLETLVALAAREDCRIRVIVYPGQLVLEGVELFAYERDEPLPEERLGRFVECFVIGPRRTPEQDFEFEIRQLVEVGVRALSPGVNDPFTAINCIDLLAIALARIARRSLPETMHRDRRGSPRVATRPTSFRNLLGTAFLQLRHDGAGRPDVVVRLLEALLLVGRLARNEEQRAAVRDFAELVGDEAEGRARSEHDRRCYRQLRERIRNLDEAG